MPLMSPFYQFNAFLMNKSSNNLQKYHKAI